MVSWTPGSAIVLERNPYYWRAGYPKLDRVVFRWFGDAVSLEGAILRDEVDVATDSAAFLLDAATYIDWEARGIFRWLASTGTTWEHLDFDLEPLDSRYVFFDDKRVRQAVAYAIDRQAIIDTLLWGVGSVPNSYIPPEHPMYTTTLKTYTYSPTLAMDLLTQAGWIDSDSDGIRDKAGQPLSFDLTTTNNALRVQAGMLMKADLAAVGIDMNLDARPATEVFADGPDGPLFGRKFDTCEFAWLTSGEPPCNLYLSEELITPANNWAGQNLVGYQNPQYDAACHAALDSLDATTSTPYYQQAMQILAEDVPMLPLFFRLKQAAYDFAFSVAPGLNATQNGVTWNIWAWDIDWSAVVTPTETTTVTGTGGTIKMTFPIGTFSEPVTVTQTPELPPTLQGALAALGQAYALTGTTTVAGLPTEPTGPYTVTIDYDDEEVAASWLDESTLALYTWDGTAWVLEPSSVVDTGANLVTATPSHFSRWAVLGQQMPRVFLPLVMSNYPKVQAPPHIVSTDPLDGATGVARSLRVVKITFNEPMQVRWSIGAAGGFDLSNDTPITYDASNYTFTITRTTTDLLPAHTQIAFTINPSSYGGGFMDLDGTPADTASFSFTTGE